MLTFLVLNNMEITCTDNELINPGFGLASGDIDKKYLLDWIIDHS